MSIVYLSDCHFPIPPSDAEKIVYFGAANFKDSFENVLTEWYDYWSPVPGGDVQIWVTENYHRKPVPTPEENWKLITRDPQKYGTFVSPSRFVDPDSLSIDTGQPTVVG